MPWATVHLAQLLSQCVIADGTPEEGAEGANVPGEKEVNKVVEMGSSAHVGPFQTEILEGKISQPPARDMHVMVTPIGHAELKEDRGHQLPPGLQVLHTYMTITAGRIANIDSGAEYDQPSHISEEGCCEWCTCCVSNVSTPRGNTFNSR